MLIGHVEKRAPSEVPLSGQYVRLVGALDRGSSCSAGRSAGGVGSRRLLEVTNSNANPKIRKKRRALKGINAKATSKKLTCEC